VKFALSGSQVTCSLEFEEGLPTVDVDSGQIGRVIQNIVLNACQSMPQGGTVSVRAGAVQAPARNLPALLAPGAHAVVEISDSGSGIPAENLQRIFDPYFTTKERGSGLGLATAFSIVRNHGGLIEVQSTPGRGSTFRVYLPAVPTPALERRASPAPAPGRAGRILLMDDEGLVRSVTAAMLAALGHTVVVTERGEAALEAWREARKQGSPFDLAILDLTIRGGMGGQETLRKLREIEPAVKAVASSGYSDDDAVAAFRAQGFVAFLKKPYQIQDLQETLNQLLV
jgi:CheY-like chemotaxis protein